MDKQSYLFPTDDSFDKSFEYKRAAKAVRKEQIHGHVDLIIKFPYMLSERQFIVSRMQSGSWHCQACPRNPKCIHIRKLHKLLQLKKEAGYDMSDKEWLKQVIPVGEIK